MRILFGIISLIFFALSLWLFRKLLNWMEMYYAADEIGDAIGIYNCRRAAKCYRVYFFVSFALGIVFECLSLFLF